MRRLGRRRGWLAGVEAGCGILRVRWVGGLLRVLGVGVVGSRWGPWLWGFGVLGCGVVGVGGGAVVWLVGRCRGSWCGLRFWSAALVVVGGCSGSGCVEVSRGLL